MTARCGFVRSTADELRRLRAPEEAQLTVKVGNDTPKLSVVVPTYNRAEIFRETLRHLAEQEIDHAEYEVVVVDDGSVDDTRAVVEAAAARTPLLRLRYIYQENHGPGHAYNRALEAAGGRIALLIADDILLSPRCVAMHLAVHERHPEEEVAVLGPAEISPMLNQSVFLQKFDRLRFRDFEQLPDVPYYRFWGCNISAKREFMLRHGGMPEEIGRGGAISHQDVVLGHRLTEGGLRILYCREALAFHHHLMTLDEMCMFNYRYGQNFRKLREWVPEPEIAVAYHVWDLTTLRDHLRVWFGPRRRFVPSSDRSPARLLARYMLRGLAFNSLTVPLVWTPLAQSAERHPALARMMRPEFYRGITAYHFCRGFRDGRTWIGASLAHLRRA
jgi:glycosyltransferase involved in cell wall biosynthesis